MQSSMVMPLYTHTPIHPYTHTPIHPVNKTSRRARCRQLSPATTSAPAAPTTPALNMPALPAQSRIVISDLGTTRHAATACELHVSHCTRSVWLVIDTRTAPGSQQRIYSSIPWPCPWLCTWAHALACSARTAMHALQTVCAATPINEPVAGLRPL